MVGNMVSLKILTIIFITAFLLLSPQIIISDDGKQTRNCLDKAVDRILEIRSLPEKTHLHTLDDQMVGPGPHCMDSLSIELSSKPAY